MLRKEDSRRRAFKTHRTVAKGSRDRPPRDISYAAAYSSNTAAAQWSGDSRCARVPGAQLDCYDTALYPHRERASRRCPAKASPVHWYACGSQELMTVTSNPKAFRNSEGT